MKRGALSALSALAALAACRPTFEGAEPAAAAPVCPTGYAPDAAREARLLVALLVDGGTPGVPRELPRLVAPVCFGPARSIGVLAGERVILRASSPDTELAARLAHLATHLEDGVGDGCARGLAYALASERRAQQLETELRARAGLGPAEDIGDAERDYASRCKER